MVDPGGFVDMRMVIDLVTDVPAERMLTYFCTALEVWMHVRSPFDFSVWLHIALCTVLFGYCAHSCREMATMLKMSKAKCAESRRFLLAGGLVQRLEAEEQTGARGRPRWKLVI